MSFDPPKQQSPTGIRHGVLVSASHLWPVLLLALATLTAGGAAWGQAVAGSTPAEGFEAHYLVVELDGTKLEPLFYRQVRLADPLVSASDDQIRLAQAKEAEGRSTVWVELVEKEDPSKATNAVAFRQAVPLKPAFRGEFHGAEDPHGRTTIEGFQTPEAQSVFVLRLPVIEGTLLRLTGTAVAEAGRAGSKRSSLLKTIDLDLLAADADRLPLASEVARLNPSVEAKNGSPANRADFLIIGDGYTAAQRGKFDSDFNQLRNQVFAKTPYREYRSYTNIDPLFVASAQSGADHPPYQAGCNSPSCCSDVTSQNDPKTGTFADTALDATYCTANIQRLLTVSLPKTLAVASARPNWDQILVMVNDSTYGGAGGALAVASLHSVAVDLMQHEMGHSFTDLADEYETPTPGFPFCRESNGTCKANVTDRSQRSQIKWLPWIRPSTPVPTPDNGFGNEIGVFEGANYRSTGQFRPHSNCLMRNLGAELCSVCAQEYVLKLFRGGFGAPARGIDPIEPGSERPAIGTIDAGSQAVTLSAGLLQPSSGSRLGVNWRVNGTTVPGETGGSFTFSPETAGTYEVELLVDAATPLVQPQMAGDALRSSRRWTVISAGVRLPLGADFLWQGGGLGRPVAFSDQSAGEPDSWRWDFGDGNTSTQQNPTHTFDRAGIFEVRLTVGRDGETSEKTLKLRIYPSAGGPCAENDAGLCLGESARFKVETLWRAEDGGTGSGGRVDSGSLDSGLFQFFGADNWELLVKVIDGCGFNDHFWVFAAAGTTVEYALRVTDTFTGSTREYLNPPGNSSPAIADTEAFAACDGAPAPTATEVALASTEPQTPSRRGTDGPGTPCADDDRRLCLLDGRFEVTLDWRDFDGNTGFASTAPARSDTSGTLWFFTPDNWEMLIKVIDACDLNGNVWVFGAAGTNVEYTLRVRHVDGGEWVEYFNAAGRPSAPITDVEALDVCP